MQIKRIPIIAKARRIQYESQKKSKKYPIGANTANNNAKTSFMKVTVSFLFVPLLLIYETFIIFLLVLIFSQSSVFRI
jgi:hypothetical protein